MISETQINIFTRDVQRLVKFYERLGFKEFYRYPYEGAPDHVEVKLNQFTIGISSVEAAVTVHKLNRTSTAGPLQSPCGRTIRIVTMPY